MKIGQNAMQNPWNRQNKKFVYDYGPGDHAETVEKGHRVKSQSYVRARPKTFESYISEF